MSSVRKLLTYRLGRLGKNTVLGSAGLGTRAIIQAAYLLLVSRWLGAEGYGLFAGTVAFASFATPMANWGSGLLLTQYIARNQECSKGMWATALLQTGVMGGLLTCIILMFSLWVLPQEVSIWPLTLLIVSELILLPATHAASSQCFALERGFAAALSVSLVPIGRLLIMLAAVLSPFSATPEIAAFAHFVGTLAGFFLAFFLITYIDGWPSWSKRLPLLHATRQGAPYAVSNIAGTSYQEVDKILMLSLLGAMLVGPYTVAFRVASIFVLPVSALISATLPRLMKQHSSGQSINKTFLAVGLTAMAYGAFAGIGILVIAPYIPWIFGQGYQPATDYLQFFAAWPVLFAVRQVLAAKLTAQGKQGLRSAIDAIGLLLIIFSNFILLPTIDVYGSIVGLLLTEIIVIVALVSLDLKSYFRKEHLCT